jgi:pimeloyl-ACP methyl ester carboxylesterase
MGKIFLIPGLGADCRIYKNIDLQGHEVVDISWITPDKNDTLASYAQKLIDYYQIEPDDIVIGNSLGGMLAVEIAKKIVLKKVVLISSIKSINEAPWYFDFFRTISVHRMIPAKRLTMVEFLAEYTFGAMSESDQLLFADMLKNTSPVFMKWAIEAILHWDNQTIPNNVYHITGDKDKVFPYKKIQGATIVKGGTHVMIFNKAKEINSWLKNIL